MTQDLNRRKDDRHPTQPLQWDDKPDLLTMRAGVNEIQREIERARLAGLTMLALPIETANAACCYVAHLGERVGESVGAAPAEQASKQVPTIDTAEFGELLAHYALVVDASGGTEQEWKEARAALIAHIDAQLAGQPAAPVAANDTLRAAILALQSAYQDEPGDDYANGFAAGHRNARWAAAELVSAAASEAAPVAATEQAKDTPESMANSNARFAIDGAIQYGRENRNPPPSADHWLAEYWNIGRQLAKLGETGWDNVTPLATPADAGAGLTDEGYSPSIIDADGLPQVVRKLIQSRGSHGSLTALYNFINAWGEKQRNHARLSTPAARPNADCSGDPSNCPDNEGHGCECGYGAPAAPVTASQPAAAHAAHDQKGGGK